MNKEFELFNLKITQKVLIKYLLKKLFKGQ